MGEVVDHTKLVLDLLNKQRLERDGSSCDVYLYSKNDDSKQLAPIRAHRSLLSLNPTIYNMLNKGNHGEWEAELDVSYDVLDSLVTYMYTGNIEFKKETVINIIQASTKYSMERLCTKAREYLNSLTLNAFDASQQNHAKANPVNAIVEREAANKMYNPEFGLDPNQYYWLSPGSLYLLSKCPISTYLEFLPVCVMCQVPVGNPSAQNEMLFFQQQMPGHEHSCHRDILLCRRINSGTNWSRVRSMPYHAARIDGPSYVQFQLCKEIMDAKPCSYGDNCTFAQSDIELDVWNSEKRGEFMRAWVTNNWTPADSLPYLKGILSRYGGSFGFSNVSTDPNRPKRQLYHKREVRIRDPRNCKTEICWHEQRDPGSCKVKDTCHFAHSDLELEVWMLLRSSSISAQQLVAFSENGTLGNKRKNPDINNEMNDVSTLPIDEFVREIQVKCCKRSAITVF
ncbi:Oidioi.mRNA.OKI2018_I69.XSR.g13596.t2.cds [Oikopleura dioica]|uniref:Oidioi.mRNA.OKI2018_I69.XSR.g13596.t2.cds n=1 Tax=Oikopleura dioica TaxID=34765 RepID=A0ABN7S7U4_OIKDI|nr:Oidioi.mRNA.OKI2018_I69.XSR.g13596.t2.cds [Oikopleura dioica]